MFGRTDKKFCGEACRTEALPTIETYPVDYSFLFYRGLFFFNNDLFGGMVSC